MVDPVPARAAAQGLAPARGGAQGVHEAHPLRGGRRVAARAGQVLREVGAMPRRAKHTLEHIHYEVGGGSWLGRGGLCVWRRARGRAGGRLELHALRGGPGRTCDVGVPLCPPWPCLSRAYRSNRPPHTPCPPLPWSGREHTVRGHRSGEQGEAGWVAGWAGTRVGFSWARPARVRLRCCGCAARLASARRGRPTRAAARPPRSCPAQVLNMLACWFDDPDGEAFKRHLPR